MLIALVSVLLVQTLAVQAHFLHHEKPGDDIVALCKGKKINLSTYAQLKQLASKVEGSQCSDESKEAISELAKVIEASKTDLCSVGTIREYAKYYNSRVYAKFGPYYAPDSRNRPESVSRFAKAYGLQVSSLCARNMIDALTGQEGERKLEAVDAEARELFNQLTGDEGQAAIVLGDLGNQGELLMPGDMRAFLEHHGYGEINLADEPKSLWAPTLTQLKRVKSVCQQSFRSIYAPYLMPLVELAKVGMSYRAKEVASRLEGGTSEAAKEIGRWSRLAFVCESLESVDIEMRPDGEASGEGKILVDIKPREIDLQIEAESPAKVVLDETQPIFDKSNKRLVAAIKSVNIHADEKKHLHDKLVRMTNEAKARKLNLRWAGEFATSILERPQLEVTYRGSTDVLIGVFDRLNRPE